MSIYAETLTQRNNAGGETNVVDCWTRFRRFLILGTEGGTYYVKAKALTEQCLECVKDCGRIDFDRAITTIVEVSEGRLAPKNTPAIAALAVLASMDNKALKALPKVCRTSTHLFEFIELIQKMRGWGRELKRAVADWYNSKSYKDVAYQVTKYQKRGGMTQKKVMRLCHIKARDPIMSHIVKYVINRKRWESDCGQWEPHSFEILNNAELAKSATQLEQIVHLISNSEVTWEMIPTRWLACNEVWEALVERGMPNTALIRNLGRITSLKVLKPFDNLTNKVSEQLQSLKGIHPYELLVANKMYRRGRGLKGSLMWEPINQIADALEVAFQKSFHYLEPTNDRTLIGLDVSGSMGWTTIENGILSCAEGGAALIKALLQTSKSVETFAFSNVFKRMLITKNDSLEAILRRASEINYGSTDCAVPMKYALENQIVVDKFIIITDNEHWAGDITPDEALRRYRREVNKEAKLIAIAMAANEFSICKGKGTLNVVGFDSTVPQLVSSFND